MTVSKVCLLSCAVLLTGYAGTGHADDNPAWELDKIRVLGDRTDDQPGAVSYLDAETILQQSADHPAEILNLLPGVNVQMNSGQEHLIAIRSPVLTAGAGQGSFLLLQNGVPTRSPAFGNVNMLFEVHHEIAEVVEVVRGPGSAKYGSNAVHGLMNFILPEPSVAMESSVRASGSSLGRAKGDLLLSGQDSYLALSLHHDNGWRDNTGIDQHKLSAGKAFELGFWSANAWFSLTNLHQETAGFIEGDEVYKDKSLSTTNPNPEAFRDARSAMAAVKLDRSFQAIDISVTPYARWQDMTFSQHFLPYKGLEENSHGAFGVLGRASGDAGSGEWRLGGMIDLARGDLIETQSDPFGFFPGDTRFPVGEHYNYTVDTFAAALWGEYEYSILPDLRLLAGLRIETHEYQYDTHIPAGVFGRFKVPEDRTDRFDLVTPKLGLIWDRAIGDLSLYLNYARGERAPQASDLYRLQDQQTVGDIKSETLDSLEIGARGEALSGRLVFDLAGYVMKKDNFFFRDSQGLNVPDGKTDHAGIELSALFAVTDRVQLSGNLGWADHTYDFNRAADNIRAGNKVDTAPEWLGDIRLDIGVSEVWAMSVQAEYIGSYYTDAGNLHEYDGHVLVSARTGYDLTSSLEVWAAVRNLLDERYADRADFAFGVDRYFPGEPQSLVLGLRKSW